jgi:hypothetical protein
MAAASHVTSGIYGKVFGQPPYIGTTSNDAFTRFVEWDSPLQMSFPAQGTVFHQVTPGQRVGNTSNYIYSVIEFSPTGLTPNGNGDKYASNQSVATLATNVG